MLYAVALLAAGSAHGQAVDATVAPGLSPDVLQSRIGQLQESSAYDEQTRVAALELYQRAVANLAAADAHDEAAEAFRLSITDAPAETERVRSAIAEQADSNPLDGLAVTGDAAATDIEELLRRERGNEASARARVTEFRQKLSSEENRPREARERASAATEELRAVAERMAQPDPEDEADILVEARRTARQASDAVLRAEIRKLDQEILSHPVRIVLLQAQADQAALFLDQQQARVRALQGLLSERRRDETERILSDLGLESLQAGAPHSAVERLVRDNGELADELDELTASVDALSKSNQAAEMQLEETRQRFERARSRLDVAGLGQALGRYLAQERRELPAASDYRRESSLRENQISEATIRNISLLEQARATRNVEAYVDAQLVPLPGDQAELLRPTLVRLVEARNGLQQQVIGLNGTYMRLLADNGYTQSQLFEVISEYRDYLAEHLMWVRSRSAFGRADIAAFPGELAAFFAPGRWVDAAGIFVDRLLRSPLQIAALLFVLLFYWRMTSLRSRLHATASGVNKPSVDSFASTIKAVALSVFIALPWPAFVAVTGYEVANATEASSGARAIGTGLLLVSPMFLVLQCFRILCTPGGVAEGHFRWTSEGVAILRRQLDLLTLALLVPAFGLVVNRELDDTAASGGLNQILLVILAAALMVFFYRLLRPTTGIAHRMRRRVGEKPLVRFPRLSIALATLFPLAVSIMSMAGFMHSAGTVLRKLLLTALLLFVVIIARELIVRWLRVAKRRLLLQEALQRREAAAREASGEAPSSDETPEYVEDSVDDIATLDADTRKLINVTLVIGLILGLLGIWSSVLPALGIFRDVTLWRYIVTVGGEETLRAVTLVHLFIAAIVAVVTIVASRNIPSLIEIILRQRPSINSGSRLAFATLARYTIATVGTVATLSIVGINWAKLQWLVAGLSVGIGFGLREIIANFVSGLIILVERPVRVGDMVTVGGQSGTVTRVQIRATTLRTWDRQELLVPNKDFIAAHVLNWSLSDEIIRIYFTVGVAYGSDVEQSLRLIQEAAVEHPGVLSDPEPLVTFEQFGDNALVLGLRCFVPKLDSRLSVQTDLHRAINSKFEAAGIVVSFPQRDLHLDTASPLEIRLMKGAGLDP